MTSTQPIPPVERMLFAALDALTRADTQPWGEMFHDDGAMEFPYAPPGYPERLDGKPAIVEFMRTYPDHLSVERVLRGGVYHAGEVMVVEFGLEVTAVPTGKRVEMNYVGVLTIKDDKIMLYRDYWNPLVAMQSMGGYDAFLALANGEQSS